MQTAMTPTLATQARRTGRQQPATTPDDGYLYRSAVIEEYQRCQTRLKVLAKCKPHIDALEPMVPALAAAGIKFDWSMCWYYSRHRAVVVSQSWLFSDPKLNNSNGLVALLQGLGCKTQQLELVSHCGTVSVLVNKGRMRLIVDDVKVPYVTDTGTDVQGQAA